MTDTTNRLTWAPILFLLFFIAPVVAVLLSSNSAAKSRCERTCEPYAVRACSEGVAVCKRENGKLEAKEAVSP
jgi:hypothetical protein